MKLVSSSISDILCNLSLWSWFRLHGGTIIFGQTLILLYCHSLFTINKVCLAGNSAAFAINNKRHHQYQSLYFVPVLFFTKNKKAVKLDGSQIAMLEELAIAEAQGSSGV